MRERKKIVGYVEIDVGWCGDAELVFGNDDDDDCSLKKCSNILKREEKKRILYLHGKKKERKKETPMECVVLQQTIYYVHASIYYNCARNARVFGNIFLCIY